jgi:hypothetical protein
VRVLAGGLLAGGLLAAGVPGVAAAQAQAGGTPAWLRARLDGRLDPRLRVSVEKVIDSALAAGVPAEPLVDKALEGASKHAPGEAILRAVRTLAGDLARARLALGAQALPAELTAGASALRAGVSPDVLRQLRADRAGQPLVVSLGVLTDLVARGVPVNDASGSVLALSRLGLADEQLVAFRRDVERDIGLGAPPGTAALLQTNTFRVNASIGGESGGPVRTRTEGRPRVRP